MIRVASRDQNFIFLVGLNFDLDFLFIVIAKIRIEARRATTPPSLEGMDRRIAYANRKYHSGWMCTGVDRGLAKFRFSTSPKRSGSQEIIIIIAPPTKGIGNISFTVNEGLNLILSRFLEVPVGLEDPVSWRVIR